MYLSKQLLQYIEYIFRKKILILIEPEFRTTIQFKVNILFMVKKCEI